MTGKMNSYEASRSLVNVQEKHRIALGNSVIDVIAEKSCQSIKLITYLQVDVRQYASRLRNKKRCSQTHFNMKSMESGILELQKRYITEEQGERLLVRGKCLILCYFYSTFLCISIKYCLQVRFLI